MRCSHRCGARPFDRVPDQGIVVRHTVETYCLNLQHVNAVRAYAVDAQFLLKLSNAIALNQRKSEARPNPAARSRAGGFARPEDRKEKQPLLRVDGSRFTAHTVEFVVRPQAHEIGESVREGEKALMVPMSHMSSRVKPKAASASKSASSTFSALRETFRAKSSMARCRGVMSALR